MSVVKAHELRNKEEASLLQELTRQRSTLAGLRVSKVSSQPQAKLAKIKEVRKSIARVLTVIAEKRITAARTDFKNKKYAPRDLRRKGTRAYRRRLTQFERSQRVLSLAKRQDNSRLRKYALAA